MRRAPWTTPAPENDQLVAGSVRAVYALEGQSTEDTETRGRQKVELIVVEKPKAEQDVFARCLAQVFEI